MAGELQNDKPAITKNFGQRGCWIDLKLLNCYRLLNGLDRTQMRIRIYSTFVTLFDFNSRRNIFQMPRLTQSHNVMVTLKRVVIDFKFRLLFLLIAIIEY